MRHPPIGLLLCATASLALAACGDDASRTTTAGTTSVAPVRTAPARTVPGDATSPAIHARAVRRARALEPLTPRQERSVAAVAVHLETYCALVLSEGRSEAASPRIFRLTALLLKAFREGDGSRADRRRLRAAAERLRDGCGTDLVDDVRRGLATGP